ncbi:MAG TPA: hypothetical protein PKL73_17975 [Polyangiaceae bacterium]|nr:hypothetical protein [Polyangiaceae bacterium]HNZ25488.1 hypothetical protein [Polyangiaceae bacterium]HOD25725.1 hypothetical protein [Polyangiaceae bacterium]HOE51460.1 hypothetical protein [Polyangiaceae bacterium]HOH03721.1 hypothetical protein [Polyangiaceae bacterium]
MDGASWANAAFAKRAMVRWMSKTGASHDLAPLIRRDGAVVEVLRCWV